MQPESLKPWENSTAIPAKPEDSEYGYYERGVLHSCTREQLIERVSGKSFWAVTDTSVLVWTPETETLVPPEDVPYLFDALKERIRKGGDHEVGCGVVGLIFFVLILVLTSIGGFPQRRIIMYLLLIFFLPAVYALWSAAKTRKKLETLTPEQVKAETDFRLAVWTETFKLTWTKTIGACFVAVWIFECIFDSSIEAAGLVKANARNGEYWRLLTCAFLHVNFQHVFMNFLSFMAIGRMVEVFLHRSHLTIVFVLAALGGSLCSLWLLPNTTSVGASGGIMGLVGLLGVASWKRKEIMPRNYTRRILTVIGITALIGLIGFDFIDNAAHFGGLLMGFLLGLVLLKTGDTSLPLRPSKIMENIGLVSLLLGVLGAAWAVFVMFGSNHLRGGVAAVILNAIVFALPKWKYFDKF